MSAQCINTYCLYTQQADQDVCERCGCSLIIKERLLATSRLGQVNNIFSSPRTQTFDAVDLTTNEEVILRVVHSDQEMLVRPLKDAVVALRHVHALSPHPGVMQMVEGEYGYFTWKIRPDEPEAYCMVTKKVPGITLQEWTIASGAVDESLATQWLRQLLSAVRELHLANFLHRDIKPENIIVTNDLRLVLIDFDAICSIDSISLGNSVSRMGTAMYMAPEHANGEPRPASDLYSIGRVMTELLTGKMHSDIARAATDKVDWEKEAPRISKPFTLLIDRLVNPNTIYRPVDAGEALSCLSDLESEIARRKKWRWIDNAVVRTAAVLIALFACMGIGASFSQTQSEASRLLAEGNQLILNGATKEGLALIEEASVLEPQSVEIKAALAIAYAFAGDYSAAVENYEIVLEREPDNPYNLYNLANVYDEMGDTESAITYYIESSEIDSPIRVSALNNLARMYLLTGDLQSVEATLAEIDLDEVENDDPQDKMAVFKNIGWLRYLQGDLDAAEVQLYAALDADPTQPDAYCLLALIQQERGEDNFNDKVTCLNLRVLVQKPELDEWKQQLTETQ